MIAWLRRVLHVHGDPDWQVEGVNAYYECRCGARRVRMAYANMAGPSRPGWPLLVDRHGRSVRDSGWQS